MKKLYLYMQDLIWNFWKPENCCLYLFRSSRTRRCLRECMNLTLFINTFLYCVLFILWKQSVQGSNYPKNNILYLNRRKKERSTICSFCVKKQPKQLPVLQKKWRVKCKKWRAVVVKWCEVEYYGITSYNESGVVSSVERIAVWCWWVNSRTQ